jgi:hypothetical protein
MSRIAIIFLVVITLGLAILLALLGVATLQSNAMGWFLLITGSVYFFGVIIVYWIRRIRFWRPRAIGKIVREERDDWSFWTIVAGMIAAFICTPLSISTSKRSFRGISGCRSRVGFSFSAARCYLSGRGACWGNITRGMFQLWMDNR